MSTDRTRHRDSRGGLVSDRQGTSITGQASDTIERYCLGCDYSLQGLTEDRCPECGRPSDANTFYTGCDGTPMGPTARWWYRPIGIPISLTATAAAGLILWDAAVPGGHLWARGYGVFASVLVLLAWWTRFVTFRGVARRYGAPGWKARARRYWLYPPLAIVLALLLSWTNVPIYTGFFVSKYEMDRLARRAAGQKSYTHHPDQLVGIYPAEDVVTVLGGVRFRVPGSGRPAGFAWFPGYVPTGSVAPRYRRIFGNWYIWRDEHPRYLRRSWLHERIYGRAL